MNETFNMKDLKSNRLDKLKKETLKQMKKNINLVELIEFCVKLYEKGFSGLDLIYLIENNKLIHEKITNEKKYELLVTYNKVKKEFRNEKLLILFILNYFFLSLDISLENISFM